MNEGMIIEYSSELLRSKIKEWIFRNKNTNRLVFVTTTFSLILTHLNCTNQLTKRIDFLSCIDLPSSEHWIEFPAIESQTNSHHSFKTNNHQCFRLNFLFGITNEKKKSCDSRGSHLYNSLSTFTFVIGDVYLVGCVDKWNCYLVY